MYICRYIYTHIFIHKYVQIYVYIYIYVCIYTRIHTFMHIHTHVRAHVHIAASRQTLFGSTDHLHRGSQKESALIRLSLATNLATDLKGSQTEPKQTTALYLLTIYKKQTDKINVLTVSVTN